MSQAYLRVDPTTSLALEAFTPPDGKTIADCFTAEIAAMFKPAGGGAIGQAWSGTAFVAPAAATKSKADLAAYAEAKHIALRDGGITVNIGTATTPDEVNVASDVDGRSLVAGAVQLVGLAAQSGQPAPTFPWIDGGTMRSLSGAQMQTIGLALGSFVQATYATLGTVLAGIADGTITTTAAIDAAAWPSTSC